MKSSSVELSIGELAARFGLAPHVLRHWESIGLLRPARRVNGRRRYTAEHVGLVALILRGKDAGFSLEQMRDLLVAPDGETRRALLTDHLAALDAKIAQLQRARALVEHTLKCTADDFLTCPDLHALLDELVAESLAVPDPAQRSGSSCLARQEP
ncbi:regulatory protein MerR [Thermobifida fusca TM51]|jgi:MerR family copper efflux transcriptional regulator|uniref:Regulatory protein MerR n=1 Tax=Thermobifida fusca TM51 TaxID=1169414 RepID=A0A9P2TCC9_THEFU|nr:MULTISPECIES: MerR family transcriptional regulator [Thermobifida]EOR72283.1 regulatory protein MerR [Thermobifida fusca TM51]MBO2529372.1 MerR family transcriptional regulator [Thermobifida sp.]MDD6792608.1 MerR family transcriptional regulator [Thermobifida fusca]PPS96505.1 MerR family transcriptional regulator [Thermobifida fusca]PZN64525.1 MAG: MerR family transcriptional regulator [Thermobifida fusca]